ncbi:hypothetical protein [Wenzhouxiangella sp. XN24]|uniref:hypothetical protein n=1 Tax=Wenzhouxiangella sp. XN24 TaxID=2713569 RepID=UPI0013EE3CC8|nr:hypothetical protein [Wenzhouxiangella sp. XN24]NGX17311.1 hypothetical protein [Wenzhouxiangella sp. XN24]
MTRGVPQSHGRAKRSLRWPGALAFLVAVALASGCGMYGDLMLEERPVRTPEITELEPISVPPGGAPEVPVPPADPPVVPPSDVAGPGDGDEGRKKNEDDPAGGS